MHFSLGTFSWASKTHSPGANWDIRRMARRAKPRDGLRKKYLAHRGETRLKSRAFTTRRSLRQIRDKKLDSRLRGSDSTFTDMTRHLQEQAKQTPTLILLLQRHQPPIIGNLHPSQVRHPQQGRLRLGTIQYHCLHITHLQLPHLDRVETDHPGPFDA